MEIITRQQDLAAGLPKYFTGKPCVKGHISARSTRGKYCDQCMYEFGRAYYADGRAKEAQRKHRAKNVEKYREYDRNRGKRNRSDPVKRLTSNMRCLLNHHLRKRGFTKRSRTAHVLGCSWEEFAAHIERQFLPGMTWENRHLWQIDHIVPMSTAKTEADVLSLNHVSNLRPAWSADNRSKSDKVLYLL